MIIITYRDMNNPPDAAFPKLVEYGANFFFICEVGSICLDLGRVTVLLRGICRESIASNLRNPRESRGEGVVVVVDREDLVPTGERKG